MFFATDRAEAGGYQLRQQGTGALGSAVAGATAGAHGLENLFFNPAVAGLVDAPAASVTATLIAPQSEITQARGTNAAGAAANGRARVGDAMPNPVAPALYAAIPLDAEVAGGKLSLGFSASAPFGLETDYGRDWQGRYHAVGTEVTTYNLNPMLAFRPSDTLTLGAGVQAQYYRGVLSNAVFTPSGDGFAEVDADDWALGFNLGALWTPVAGTRLGVAYRSAVDHSLEGGADFSARVPFPDANARADVTTPRSVSMGLSQRVSERWTLLGEAQWTDWSTFDSLEVAFDNPGQPDDITRQDWNDGWFAAVGVRYRASEALAVSAGAAYDWSPAPDDTLTPRIPDADRAWLSLGVDWTPESWVRLKLGYAHLFMPSRTIDLDAGDPGNGARGDLTATTDTDVDIVSVTLSVSF
nr:outer membrane protein transport protein [Rhodovibrio salinarum]